MTQSGQTPARSSAVQHSPAPSDVLSLDGHGSTQTRFRTFQVWPKDFSASLRQVELAVDRRRPRRVGGSLMSDVRRREFIWLLGFAAAAWPLETRAQQRERIRRIGALMAFTGDDPE